MAIQNRSELVRLTKIRNAWGSQAAADYGTPLSSRKMEKNLDKVRGCLLGGAAGDALGYPVEFLTERQITAFHGERGITEYILKHGIAQVSDDTQMTLYTANGLLFGSARGKIRGIMGPYSEYLSAAYLEWYRTQTERYPLSGEEDLCCWLSKVPSFFSCRAPGSTCLNSCAEGANGSPEKPINSSKGCGGIMRVAPIGLYFCDPRMPALTVDLLGADAAALTHGHELGYLPAAMAVHMIWLLSHTEDVTLPEAVTDSKEAITRLFPDAVHLPELLQLVDQAVALSRENVTDLEAIHQLGEGWVAEETLAIAIYCALKYENDFDAALQAAVNHNGDSDSTGAVTGNLLGARLGLSAIPKKYLENLEGKDVVLSIADDLCHDYDIDEYNDPETQDERKWYHRYVDILPE